MEPAWPAFAAEHHKDGSPLQRASSAPLETCAMDFDFALDPGPVRASQPTAPVVLLARLSAQEAELQQRRAEQQQWCAAAQALISQPPKAAGKRHSCDGRLGRAGGHHQPRLAQVQEQAPTQQQAQGQPLSHLHSQLQPAAAAAAAVAASAKADDREAGAVAQLIAKLQAEISTLKGERQQQQQQQQQEQQHQHRLHQHQHQQLQGQQQQVWDLQQQLKEEADKQRQWEQKRANWEAANWTEQAQQAQQAQQVQQQAQQAQQARRRPLPPDELSLTPSPQPWRQQQAQQHSPPPQSSWWQHSDLAQQQAAQAPPPPQQSWWPVSEPTQQPLPPPHQTQVAQQQAQPGREGWQDRHLQSWDTFQKEAQQREQQRAWHQQVNQQSALEVTQQAQQAQQAASQQLPWWQQAAQPAATAPGGGFVNDAGAASVRLSAPGRMQDLGEFTFAPAEGLLDCGASRSLDLDCMASLSMNLDRILSIDTIDLFASDDLGLAVDSGIHSMVASDSAAAADAECDFRLYGRDVVPGTACAAAATAVGRNGNGFGETSQAALHGNPASTRGWQGAGRLPERANEAAATTRATAAATAAAAAAQAGHGTGDAPWWGLPGQQAQGRQQAQQQAEQLQQAAALQAMQQQWCAAAEQLLTHPSPWHK